MKVAKPGIVSTLLAALLLGSAGMRAMAEPPLWFFVLVKSSNYSQDREGELTRLNYHFFSELFGRDENSIRGATLQRTGNNGESFVYEDRGKTWYYEGGHFDSVAAVDRRHPNGSYRFRIEAATGDIYETTMQLAGPEGRTDIPAPIHIYFSQRGKKLPGQLVDPALPLSVTWSAYSNGRADPRGIVDDMIFVVFQDCHGERVFHTGLPFQEADYLRYDSSGVTVPASSFAPGQTYSMFVEFPHVVDSTLVDGVPGFTSYATATYTDIVTRGTASGPACPDSIPPLDTGQTDRMDVDIEQHDEE